MAAAVISGVGHDRLLRSSDRAEVIVEAMLVDVVLEHREKLREREINLMANEIAKRFS